MKTSSGFIVYRKNNGKIEFFLGHPGGPFYTNKNFFTFIKGEKLDNETLFENAKREFLEETGLSSDIFEGKSEDYIGCAKQSKKIVHAFLINLNIDETKCKSNNCLIEYPKNSKKYIEIPEIDKYQWMTFEELQNVVHYLHIPLYLKALDKINIQ